MRTSEAHSYDVCAVYFSLFHWIASEGLARSLIRINTHVHILASSKKIQTTHKIILKKKQASIHLRERIKKKTLGARIVGKSSRIKFVTHSVCRWVEKEERDSSFFSMLLLLLLFFLHFILAFILGSVVLLE